MKKWLKWMLGIIAVLVLIIAGFIIWNWTSFQILGGTEDISGTTSEIPIAITGELPEPDSDQVSVQCYHGPADTSHWIRFDDFRIRKLED